MRALEFPYSTLPEWETVSGSFDRQPGHIHLLSGASGIFTLSLALAGATHRPFAVVDGAMRFNSYTLSRIASSIGIPPRTLLRRVHVTRSFTAFQTEAALTIKLPRFLATTGCSLVVVLGLLDTYYDEQVSLHECRQSLGRTVAALRQLTQQNIHVLLADIEVTQAPSGKEKLFQILRGAADTVTVFEQGDIRRSENPATTLKFTQNSGVINNSSDKHLST